MPQGGLGGLGKLLLVTGGVLAAVGVLLVVAERFPGLRIGRLPGDIAVERERFRFYFPLGTSIVVSIVLTLLFWLLGRRG
ncbi:MAG TPA: DUF2905 domain-containing protein [Anaeromyxobacter sp.]